MVKAVKVARSATTGRFEKVLCEFILELPLLRELRKEGSNE